MDPDHSNFTFVATELGCTANPQGQVECMRKLPATGIINYIANYTNSNTQPPLFFIGTPDERTVFSNYAGRYERGFFSRVPVLLGTNSMEGELFAPFPTTNPQSTSVNQTLADRVTLSLFQCPGAQASRLRAATGRKTYRYIYEGNFADVSPLFWEGAYHAAELPQIFGTCGQFRGPASSFEVQTSQAMQDLWLGFAQRPGSPEKFGWKETKTDQVLQLGAAGSSPVEAIDASVIDSPCQQAGIVQV